MARAREADKKSSSARPFSALMREKSWAPLPAFVALTPDADFFQEAVIRRFNGELFSDPDSRSITRIDGSKNADGLLARVLDELRTLSILSPQRLVIIDHADAFVSAHRDDLEPHVEPGFSDGHLILKFDKALNSRTKLAKAIAKWGWIVDCKKPFDRPPPWKTGEPPWNNPLSEWIAGWARSKGLSLDLETAFHLQERVGTDLALLDKSLDKIQTFLGPESRTVEKETIDAITADIREDTVFELVERFILGDRARSLETLERLLENGVTSQKGPPVHDPMAISLIFLGTLIPKLRNLRQAHALRARGEGSQSWVEHRLTPRFLLERFQRELQAMPPRRLHALFPVLLKMDRRLKTGASPREELTLLLARH